MSDLTEFLLARIAEDEADPWCDGADEYMLCDHWSHRHLAEAKAKRRIVEWHENWPVLVETEPELVTEGSDPLSITVRMTQQVGWLTNREYVARFGTEPPSAPLLLAIAAVYADHPDFREEWRP